jgi:peroxiredoxin
MTRAKIAVALLLAALAGTPFIATSARAEDPAAASQAPAAPTGLKVGEAAPNATFTDPATSKPVEADSLWAKRPVVVVFYRGGWCPYCTKSLEAWQGRMADLKAAGADFVAVAMEKPSFAAETRSKHKLEYTLLTDPTGAACRAYKTLFDLDEKTKAKYEGYGIDLSKHNENGKWQLPVPATYVIDTQGKVRYVQFDPDYTKRASPDAVITAVKSIK